MDIALTIDAVQVVSRALQKLVLTSGSRLSRTFRHGQMYNNGSRGIQCNIRPKYGGGGGSSGSKGNVGFEHGDLIMNEIKKVKFGI